VYKKVKEEIQKLDPDRELDALNHDAGIISFIVWTRSGRTHVRYAKCWMVTQDKKLPRLNNVLSPRLPVVLNIDAWLAIFRKLIPRVHDFDQFFASIVTRQIIPSFYVDGNIVLKFSRLSNATRDANLVLNHVLNNSSDSEIQIIVSSSSQEHASVMTELVEKVRSDMTEAREYTEKSPISLLNIERISREADKNQYEISLTETEQRIKNEFNILLQEKDKIHQTKIDEISRKNEILQLVTSKDLEKYKLENTLKQLKKDLLEKNASIITFLILFTILVGIFISFAVIFITGILKAVSGVSLQDLIALIPFLLGLGLWKFISRYLSNRDEIIKSIALNDRELESLVRDISDLQQLGRIA
jgi:hypothetical protein